MPIYRELADGTLKEVIPRRENANGNPVAVDRVWREDASGNRILVFRLSTTETLRPASDITDNGWNDFVGDSDGLLWDELDETSGDQATTAIQTGTLNGAGAASFRVGLSDTTGPKSRSQNHSLPIQYRAKNISGSGAITITVWLYQGGSGSLGSGTLIDSTSFPEVSTNVWQQNTLSVDPANITNWDQLEVEVRAENTGGAPGSPLDTAAAEVSFIELAIGS